MAAGITQSGTVIIMEDDAHADADLAAPNDEYGCADIIAKALSSGDFIDLGTNASEKAYRSRATLRLGDTSGVAVTNFVAANCSIVLDASRNFETTLAGGLNKKVTFGDKVSPAVGKPFGRNGVKLTAGATIFLRGTTKLYGSVLKSITGNTQIIPAAPGSGSELLDCTVYPGGNASAFGISPNNIATIRRLTLLHLSDSPSAVITNWCVDDAEDIKICCKSPSYFINTGATVLAVKRFQLNGSPTLGDIRNTAVGATWHLIETLWSGNKMKLYSSNGYVDEWWPWDDTFVDDRDGMTPMANIPVTIEDVAGNDLMGVAYTNASGQLDYNLDGLGRAIFDKQIKAMTLTNPSGAYSEYDHGPFTVRANQSGITNPAYLPLTYKFLHPRTTYLDGALVNSQLEPVQGIRGLRSRYGYREDSRESYA